MAEDGSWSSSASGIVDFWLKRSLFEKNNLVPNPDLLGLEPFAMVQTNRVNLEVWKGPLALNTQLRLALVSDQDQKVKKLVDELYAEYTLTDETFLYLGRRNIVFGQSYGTNPLDMFFDPIDLDWSINESRRRREVEGQDMLGFEFLASDVFSWSGYWAPSSGMLNENDPDRVLIAAKLLWPEWNADVTLLAFEDDRSGMGLSFTKSVGNAILLYGDATLRWGRDRLLISRNLSPAALPGEFVTEDDDSKQQYVESSIGFSYTFESSATINAEYYFNQNGYAGSEWDKIAQVIEVNNITLEQGGYGRLPEGNLLSLNNALRHYTLHQHYGFIRAYHPDPFDLGITTETTVFHNLEDQSGVASLRVEYEVKPSVLLGVYTSTNYGNGMDEFWLRGNKLSGVAYVTIYL